MGLSDSDERVYARWAACGCGFDSRNTPLAAARISGGDKDRERSVGGPANARRGRDG